MITQKNSGFCINLLKQGYGGLGRNLRLTLLKNIYRGEQDFGNQVPGSTQLRQHERKGVLHSLKIITSLEVFYWGTNGILLGNCPNQWKLPIGNCTWMTTS